MTDRIKRLKSHIIRKDGVKVTAEKFKIALEAARAAESEPNVQIRAKQFAAVLEKIPIHILPDELIVGTPNSVPWGMELEEALDVWDEDELLALREWGAEISDETIAEVLEMNKQFTPFSMYAAANLAVKDNKVLNDFVQTGLCLAPWKKDPGNDRVGRVGGGNCGAGIGLAPAWTLQCIDWELVVSVGFRRLIEKCDEEIQKTEFFDGNSYDRAVTLRAMKLCLESVIRYAERHAALAEELAAKERDPQRKKELAQIAEHCRRVPAYPARTFWEGLQAVWFVFEAMIPCPTTPFGRFDQYMYHLYRDDIRSGRATDADIVELLDCLRIRCMEINSTGGKEIRKRGSGGAGWYNITIGGVKPDGSDATNELSYLVLESVLDCPTTHPTVTVRVSDSTPDALLLKGIQCQAEGRSMPAFVGDQSYIKFFTTPLHEEPGVPLEIARDYCMTGCIDGNLPGKSRSMSVSMFVAPLVLDVFLHSGWCHRVGLHVGHDYDFSAFRTFDEFLAAFKTEWKYFISLAVQKNNIENTVMKQQYADPFRSALMSDGIDVGLDMQNRRFIFENSSLLNTVGFVNLGQSIYSIKKLCFDEKRVTLPELIDILDKNWEGHEDLRQYCLSLPHYGNDVDEVDYVLADLYDYYQKTACSFRTPYGGYTRVNAISVSAHEPGGALTGATPDGRYRGEVLADANLSPMRGFDRNGPLAVFKSAMKVNQDNYQAVLMNMKFHPSALRSDEDKMKLASAIRTYFRWGGKMVQFNVVARETLQDAQVNPAKHSDLMVRVAGYSAYFVQLTPGIQRDLIDRSEHSFV